MTSSSLDHLAGKNVLVTGGTGFVGRHLLPRLVQAGAHVTCLVRAGSDVSRLPRQVKVVRGSLHASTDVAAALKGQDVLIHMAALLFGLGWQDYIAANAKAATAIARAFAQLEQAGQPAPQRVVLVSSLSASGPCATGEGVGDDCTPAPVSAYGWSKLLVEQILGRALGDRLVVLRPPIIYGSGDKGLLPVFRGVGHGIAVSPGMCRNFPVSAIHAQDVGRAIICCCLPQARGVYHVNDGAQYDMGIFCRIMGHELGRRNVLVLHLPLCLMGLTAALSSLGGTLWALLCRALGKTPGRAPNWNLDKYREAHQPGWLCDASRIRRELGFEAKVDLANGMGEAVNGYRRDGWL